MGSDSILCAILTSGDVDTIVMKLLRACRKGPMSCDCYHHLFDSFVDLSDLYIDLLVHYVDLSNLYADLSDLMSTCELIMPTCHTFL